MSSVPFGYCGICYRLEASRDALGETVVFSAFRLLRYLLPRHRNPLMGNGARRIGDGTQFFHYRDRGGSEAFRLGEVVLIVFRSLC